MYDLVHAMRTRMVSSDPFNGERVMGAILFEGTMNREINGMGFADYLWSEKNVVPFVKVDKGLADEADGIQLLNDIPNIIDFLDKAREKGVFGTKMRSVIKQANEDSIKRLVDQQFSIGRQIVAKGLVPILEPEVDIHCPDKQKAEDFLRTHLLKSLDGLSEDELVMLKLTLPETGDHYKECVEHKNILKVVALSGGYDRQEANRRLAQNGGMVASFSRALLEGLQAQMSDQEFENKLDDSIQSIYTASAA